MLPLRADDFFCRLSERAIMHAFEMDLEGLNNTIDVGFVITFSIKPFLIMSRVVLLCIFRKHTIAYQLINDLYKERRPEDRPIDVEHRHLPSSDHFHILPSISLFAESLYCKQM